MTNLNRRRERLRHFRLIAVKLKFAPLSGCEGFQLCASGVARALPVTVVGEVLLEHLAQIRIERAWVGVVVFSESGANGSQAKRMKIDLVA
jgi:hypothetical protein